MKPNRKILRSSTKPVLRRLLPPLTVMLVLLGIGAGAILWQQQRQRLAEHVAEAITEASGKLHEILDHQAAGLATAIQPIAADPGVQTALRKRDAARLLAAWRPMFETLRRENHITHFYFFGPDRVCLLRVHKPEKGGDLVNRFTALEAERTGRTASGIEVGPLGTFTLRVVKPVFAEGGIVGYVELGKEIEEVLHSLHSHSSSQLAVVIRKDILNRQTWEEGMRLLGREADWDRLPHSAVIYASQGRLPDAFARWADDSVGVVVHGEVDREIPFDGRDWRVSAIPLQDVSGAEVGDLLVMRDISPQKAAFARLVLLAGTSGMALLVLLLGFVYILLRRTDAGIRGQQAELRASEENLSATLRSIGDGVVACDVEGNVVNLNAVAETLTGWNTDEAKGRPIAEVFRILHAETRQEAEIPVGRAMRDDRTIGLANHTALIARNGTERQIADSCSPIHDAAGVILGAVLVFRDVTEEYRQRQELRQSQERFDQLAQQSRTIAWEVDTSGLYTYISPVVELVLGYRPEELVGQMHFYDLHGESQREAFKNCAFAIFRRRDSYQDVVNAAQAKDGRQVWLSTNGIPLLNADGSLRGYRGSTTDITARMLAEEALRESEERHRLILDHSSDLIWSLSSEGIFTYASPSWNRVTGHEPSSIVGTSFELLVHPEDIPTCRGCLLNIRETKKIAQSPDYRVRHADGTWHWHNTTGTPVLDPGGEVVSIVAVSRDITERRRAEVIRQEALDRLQKIAGRVPGLVYQYRLRADGSVCLPFASEAIRELFRVNPEDVREDSSKLFANLHPDDRDGIGSTIQKSARDLTPWQHEFRVKFDDGTIRSLYGNALPQREEDGSVLWHGFITDITERKRAEEVLRQTTNRLSLAARAGGVGIWDYDVVNNGLVWDDQMFRLYGITREQFGGAYEAWRAGLHPEDRQQADEEIRLALGGEKDFNTEFRVVWPDGSIRTIRALAIVQRDASGLPLQMIGTNWDITEHRQTVAALESANKVLEEVNQLAESATRAKSEFLANMSHEIRTPMTAILGFAEVLLGEPDIERASPERVEAIRTIQRNGQHLLELINDILDLSKIEAGKLDVERITCSPAQVLADVMVLMRIRADAKKLPLTLEYVNGIPESIHSDPLRLRQVLINLVGNAIKFTETGSVRVAARLVQRLEQPTLLQFDVIDTGIGLSPQQTSRLFKPFNQGDSSTTRKFGGTGLGLTISKRLAEMLGGDITISSIAGQGSTFSVTVETGNLDEVKLVETPVPSAPVSSATTAAAIQLDCRILLAEDGTDNQRLLAFVLRKAGAEVTLVENGQLAVEQATIAWEQGRPFDVILMDMQMPVMDGYTATGQLRERGYTGPIVALTAHAMAEDRQKCLDAGCDDFATKPIDRQKFLATVANWMARGPRNDDSAKPLTTENIASVPMPTALV